MTLGSYYIYPIIVPSNTESSHTESTKSSYDENTLSTMHDNNESIIHHPLTANQSELQSKIMNILTEPNEKWKQLRNNYII